MNFQLFQIVCEVSSLFLNSLLIFLVLKKSPKSLGRYKYLMIYTSTFEIFYSILDIVVEPTIDNYDAAFLVFRDFRNSMFSRRTSFWLISLYCGCFGFSMALFGVHFIYRYAAVNRHFFKKYLYGKKISILYLIPLFYLAVSAALTVFIYDYNELTDAYLEKPFLKEYGLNVTDCSYMIALFYLPAEAKAEAVAVAALSDNGESPDRINYPAFAVIATFWTMIFSSMFCVFYFGTECYLQISKVLDSAGSVSHLTKSLQRQLFQALVIQTLIPVILMYIPITFLFIFPMFKYNHGFDTVFVGYTIALFPATDPLPNLLIIKCYRNAILEFLSFGKSKRRNSESGERKKSSNMFWSTTKI